ncbi:MAG TPA: (5-formylfuran-3-yl)methyl phosphate synthase, partial [Gemmatimonadales bacterium]|nr:(5-formylfuran-3-yl)methyl phosphate synthase [Gemmatimonadales bacterium]
MQLLVSVRDAVEAGAALVGGADIIDAKEPARGSLGPVGADVFRSIAARVPDSVPLSAALGDFTARDDARAAVAGAGVPARRAPVYLKLGFAGERSKGKVSLLLSAAQGGRAMVSGAPFLVPVAYADHESAGAPEPEEVLRSAIETGVGALLVDTWTKDGRRLLDHIPYARVAALSEAARGAGLVFALAGSLDASAIERVAGLADVIGVRGAACRGGRGGIVDPARVRELRARLEDCQPAR